MDSHLLQTLVIIVNYKSAAWTLKAVGSVLDSESLGPVEVRVVDNSGHGDEADRLRRGLPPPVHLDISRENIGFARACNQAAKGFRGDAILLINPDAYLLPGCLKRLQKTLFANTGVGAVSPHIFWDELKTFYLPSSYPPPSFVFQDLLESAPPDAGLSRFLSAWWRRHSIEVWEAEIPVKVDNLSGGMVLLKGDAVRTAGGLFDPDFFLYFEDTDLFLRMKRAGFNLFVEPRGQAVHHYDQCGRQNTEEKRAFMASSRQLFLEKNMKGWRRCAKKCLSSMTWFSKVSRQNFVISEFTRPFLLDVPKSIRNGWFFEVSPNANFIPSAGRFGRGPVMDFPESCWRLLAPGRYFGRLGSPHRFGGYERVVSCNVET